jgi:hypothetical protein
MRDRWTRSLDVQAKYMSFRADRSHDTRSNQKKKKMACHIVPKKSILFGYYTFTRDKRTDRRSGAIRRVVERFTRFRALVFEILITRNYNQHSTPHRHRRCRQRLFIHLPVEKKLYLYSVYNVITLRRFVRSVLYDNRVLLLMDCNGHR